jgi:hypothetical protein
MQKYSPKCEFSATACFLAPRTPAGDGKRNPHKLNDIIGKRREIQFAADAEAGPSGRGRPAKGKASRRLPSRPGAGGIVGGLMVVAADACRAEKE